MQALAILFGALFTVAVATALGALVLRDACRDLGVRFVCGAAVLSLLVFALCSLGLAYPLVFLGLGIVALWFARSGLGAVEIQPPPTRSVKYILLVIFTVYFILYLFNGDCVILESEQRRLYQQVASTFLIHLQKIFC